MGKIEAYKEKPIGFNETVEVSACYLEIECNILLLKQSAIKQETGAWGVPAGKLEKYETPQEAAYRELFEETGIQITHPSQIQGLGCLYMRKPKFDYIYHMFQVKLDTIPSIRLSQEHQSYSWYPTHSLHHLTLITGAKEGLAYYLNFVQLSSAAEYDIY